MYAQEQDVKMRYDLIQDSLIYVYFRAFSGINGMAGMERAVVLK